MNAPPIRAWIAETGSGAWVARSVEGVAVAAPLPRWLASVCDALILLLAHLLFVAPMLYFTSDAFVPLQWVARLSPLACWIYLWIGWTRGQTPGQRLFRVRIVADDGEPMTVGRALRRLIGYALVCLTFKIGLLPILFDPLRRGWHDRLAGTLVVDARALHCPMRWLFALGYAKRRIARPSSRATFRCPARPIFRSRVAIGPWVLAFLPGAERRFDVARRRAVAHGLWRAMAAIAGFSCGIIGISRTPCKPARRSPRQICCFIRFRRRFCSTP